MKLQIDTSAKTIKLEQSAKIPELLSVIKKLLPNEWKEYTLETMTVINNWTNPIIYPIYTPPIPVWSTEPSIIFEQTTSDTASCIFNIETMN